jgi:hypothetical protein
MCAFENGLMWNMYRDMERSFIRFLDYVPWAEDHKNVYSHKLLQLLLQIGGYVDTAFKEMAKYSQFDGNEPCQSIRDKTSTGDMIVIEVFRDAFEPLYELSSRKVVIRALESFTELWGNCKPFSDFKDKKTTTWWSAYNGVKHNWLENLKRANLENTCAALAGAFLLNAIHEPSVIELVKRGIAKTFLPDWQRAVFEEKSLARSIREHSITGVKILVTTRLFVYQYA